jgi:eukaryotic-like serine/threonine-protein kinase
MGEVYLGEHVDLRRPAVIKVIKSKFTREEQVVSRMRREARIVARIRHDALVTVYDLGTAADGRTYIAMEWLEGTVLRRIMQTRGALPVDEATKWMAQACDGLEAAHREGVIHRDVKPENLFVTAAGQLKVLDFGVAKPMQEGDMTSARTAAGMVLGTPRYMAPEQATGRALSAATDVYAVGCVLFEMLVGAPLFDGGDARELLWHHLNTHAPTLEQRARRRFDPQLEAVIARALHKDPAQRYPRAADLAVALRSLNLRPSTPPRIVRMEERATIKVDNTPIPENAHPTTQIIENEALADTRAIPAMNLVQGVSTTEQAPLIKTAQTEVLGEPAPGHTGALAAEVSTVERRAMPLWPFAVGVVFFAATITGLIFLLRAGDAVEKPIVEKPIAAAPKTEPTPSAEPEPAKPDPTPVAKPDPTPVAKLDPKPTPTPTPTPAPTTTAAPKASVALNNYDHAKQLMADGDLDAAEREARLGITTHGNASRLLLGEIFERKGKPALARDIYKKVLEVDPNNGVAKTRLAKLGG